MRSENPRVKLEFIELARAIAAVMVVFHHAGSIVAQPKFFGQEVFGGWLRHLYPGVDLFFVISGFIIYWIHNDELGRMNRVSAYLSKRVLRIYPLYWLVLIPLIVLYQIFPNFGVPSQREFGNIACSFFLLPCGWEPVLGVAWTLVHEMLFYFVFGLLMLIGRKALWLLVAWAAAILWHNISGIPNFSNARGSLLQFLFSPYNLEFLIGVAFSHVALVSQAAAPRFIMVIGGVAFAMAVAIVPPLHVLSIVERLSFAIPAAIYIFGAVQAEIKHSLRLYSPLLDVAAASYAIYLIHPVVLSMSATVARRISPATIAAPHLVIFSAMLAIAAGLALHRSLEVHLLRLGRSLVMPSSRSSSRILHVEVD